MSLDGLLLELEHEGVLFERDERSPSIKKYKFALDKSKADSILEELRSEISRARNYGVRRDLGNDSISEIEKGFEIDYRRFAIDDGTKSLKGMASKLAHVFGLNDFGYVASVYILKMGSERTGKIESKKLKDGSIRRYYIPPPKGKHILVLEGFYTNDGPFAEIIRNFYFVYQNLKTPSKI